MARYARRLSGPLVDRFDLRIPVNLPDPTMWSAGRPASRPRWWPSGWPRPASGPAPGACAANAELAAAALDAHGAAGTRRGRACSSGCCAERRLSARGLQRRAPGGADDRRSGRRRPPPLTSEHLSTANALRTQPACLAERLAV